MDDFLLFSDNKEYLKEVMKKIEKELNTVYCLKLNSKKSHIVNIKEGFTFCGYHFRVINSKTIITVPAATRRRVKQRIKEVRYLYRNNLISLRSCFSSIQTYYNAFKFGNKMKMRRMVDLNFFFTG